MRVFFAAAILLAMASLSAEAQENRIERLDSVVVTVSRAGEQTPVAYTSLTKTELRAASPSHSLPMTLSLQPSLVVTNEGGTGLGYSKMTVRGIKGSQINVTLNGVTLNDAESQEVFWVNIPALGSILNSVQVQRGLGTTANGAGAFGASVNMETAPAILAPTARLDVGYGSWNTLTATVSASTGLLRHGLYASAAYSRDLTDGYIRNAYAKVQSAFATVGWLTRNNALSFTWLMGDQHTGITWNGLPLEKWLAGDDRYNSAGEYYDADGNVLYYDHETDNYTQHHFQLNYTHRFRIPLTWTTTANFTKGDGYYDQMKAGKKFTKYGMASPQVIDGVEYTKADFRIKKWMDNSYGVLNSSLNYRSDRLNATAGISLSAYDGSHFGNVSWVSLLGDVNLPEWYRNEGVKFDHSVFVRAEYRILPEITAYADLQYRSIRLTMSGQDDDNIDIGYNADWHFLNPRAGLTWQKGPHRTYLSVAAGNREPGRTDLKENIKDGAWREVLPESMLDIEAGYAFTGEHLSASANLYAMEYWNMLLETGRISAVGNAIKENIPRGWRRGVELTAAWQPLLAIRLDGNLTLSINQIDDYTAYYEDWANGGYREEHIGRATMLMSPSVIGMTRLHLAPFQGALAPLSLTLSGKYVGAQYWDNTMSPDRQIPAYFVTDAVLAHTFSFGRFGSLGLALYANNLLGARYYADVWVYRAWDGSAWYQEEGLTPQAPRNFLLKVTYSF